MSRYPDPDGHDWPITGTWCTQCGLPLDDVDGRGTHPVCDPTPSATSTPPAPPPRAYRPPAGQGRCTGCGHHIAAQGHAPGCEARPRRTSAPDRPPLTVTIRPAPRRIRRVIAGRPALVDLDTGAVRYDDKTQGETA